MVNHLVQVPSKKTILVVDDSTENLKLLSGLLSDVYKIKVAKDGKKAVEIVLSDPSINLILMDVQMPIMDGFEASKLIKQSPVAKHIPIIFLTGLTDVINESKGFEAGASDFITKPFHAEIVQARIKTHLELQDERTKVEGLLKVLLPENAIQQLIEKGRYTPEVHHESSIMFCDLIDFTEISSRLSAEDLFKELSDIFSSFDEIIKLNNCIRIKTIGDAYMAASGLDNSDTLHADRLVKAGLDIIQYLEIRNKKSDIQWKVRIGINSGQIISGIVGNLRFQFDIMGDNVNIAARVEGSGVEMRVTVTEATRTLLQSEKFSIQPIGDIELKGKGKMPLFAIQYKELAS